MSIASAGTYSVTVTDDNGCTATLSVEITEPLPLVLTETHANAICAGSANGSIDLSVSGGTGTYTYNWSNSMITQDINALPLGTYTVTVTDANACTASLSIIIINVGSPNPSATTTDATCGSNDGAVDLTVTGGTLPYTYDWDNSAITQDLKNVPAGTYTVTITDANGCTAEFTAAVSNIGGPVLSTDLVVNATCEQANGSIDISVSGGTAPDPYQWSNSETSEDLTDISSGTYTVTVTDAINCIATLAITVDNLASPLLSAVVTDATCGQANGAIDVTVSGVGYPLLSTGVMAVLTKTCWT